jgi:hypothetical protein
METEEHNNLLRRIEEELPPDYQLRLVVDLVKIMHRNATSKPLRSILEFEGLGKEIWEGIDVQAYIDQERDSWDKE